MENLFTDNWMLTKHSHNHRINERSNTTKKNKTTKIAPFLYAYMVGRVAKPYVCLSIYFLVDDFLRTNDACVFSNLPMSTQRQQKINIII